MTHVSECAYKAFVTMFYALDAAYGKSGSSELGRFLSAANPILFKGEGSADIAVYEGFKAGYPDEADEVEAYRFVRGYLAEQGGFLLDAFDLIANAEAWSEALK